MKKLIVLFFTLFMFSTYSLASEEIAAGKVIAERCSSCHGVSGLSSSSRTPNLKGQNQRYLVSALKAYKNKERDSAMMSSIAEKLSDDDINNIAAYYSSL